MEHVEQSGSQDTEKVCAVKMPRYLMFGNEVFSLALMLNMIAMMTAEGLQNFQLSKQNL